MYMIQWIKNNVNATFDFLMASVSLGSAVINYSITKRKFFKIFEIDDILGYQQGRLLCNNQKQPYSDYIDMLHKNTTYFNTFEPRRDNHNGSYGRYPIHIAVIRSESVELLQLLLKIDSKLTKKKLYRDGENPLGCLCQRFFFPTQFKMLDALLEVDSSAETIACAMVFCFTNLDLSRKDISISPGIH